MARRFRKKERTYITLGILGLFVLTGFIWIISQIVWDSVAGAILALLAGASVIYSIIHFTRIFLYHRNRAQRFNAASRVKGTTNMKYMSPTEFEHYIATLYEMQGYRVKVTQQSGDGGIDVILEKGAERTAVQVKRYDQGNVGRPDVQNLVGASFKGFSRRIFVTTSDFTDGAAEYAHEHDVVLVNGATLETMAKQVFGENHKQKSFSFAFQHRMTNR